MNSDIIYDAIHSSEHIKELIIMTRLTLYNHNFCCGAKYIREELRAQDIRPLPSLTFINRALRKNGLTHRRTGLYENEG
jgi:hypothetical protein